MKYYFDESGNWENLKRKEYRSLVMCVVLFKDIASFNEVEWAFQSIRAERNLTPFEFHATYLDNSTRERVYAAMYAALKTERAKVWALRVDPVLLKKTQRSETDLYIDYASYLLSSIALPDEKPEIYSDMKFRGAYPAAVAKLAVNTSFKSNFRTFDRIMATYQPMEETIEKKKREILRLIENSLRKQPVLVLNDLKEMVETGSDAGIVKRYEFAELWLDWKEREQIREKYRETILSNLKKARQSLGIDVETTNIKLRFVDKNENNAGIQFADFVCNILYKNFPDRRFSEGDLEGRIYEKCFIEEGARL